MHKLTPQINFLPWRAEKRKEQAKQFVLALAMAALVVGVVVVAVNLFVSALVEQQQTRNNYIKSQISLLDKDLKEIKSLKTQRANMIERMRVIQGLQGNRAVIVRVFDETVKVMPKGTFFKNLSVKGDLVKVQGIAENNNEVSELMRNIDNSEWMASPNLTGITAASDVGEFASSFDLTFQLEFADEIIPETTK